MPDLDTGPKDTTPAVAMAASEVTEERRDAVMVYESSSDSSDSSDQGESDTEGECTLLVHAHCLLIIIITQC